MSAAAQIAQSSHPPLIVFWEKGEGTINQMKKLKEKANYCWAV
jgi:hypothetical protein